MFFFMEANRSKDFLDRSNFSHFPSWVCVLQSEYRAIFKSFKCIIVLVGRLVDGRWISSR